MPQTYEYLSVKFQGLREAQSPGGEKNLCLELSNRLIGNPDLMRAKFICLILYMKLYQPLPLALS
jgi:hypothetical protein